MTSSNCGAMFPNDLTTSTVVNGETKPHQQTGGEYDVKIQRSGLSDMSVPNSPRQVFNNHMQDSKTGLETALICDKSAFDRGVTAGVELTLDVIHFHGYKLIDVHGNVVNSDGSPSLACGIWNVPVSEEPTL